jgi:methyl-accepting chemotaxis protein
MLEEGRLLLAMPRERVHALTTTFPTQMYGLALLIVIATSVVALVVISRITGPIERLQGAVVEFGHGRIVVSQRILSSFPKRKDELGSLVREFRAASRRIQTIVQKSQDLSGHLGEMAVGLDQTAAALASDAARQAQRMAEIAGSFTPLIEALSQTTGFIGELTRLASNATRLVREIEQHTANFSLLAKRIDEQVSSGTTSDAMMDIRQALATLVKYSKEALTQLGQLRTNVATMVHTGNSALRGQIHEQHHGEFIQRAISDIDRLSTARSEQSSELRTTAESLRHQIERLKGALALFDTRGMEGAARSASLLPAPRASCVAAPSQKSGKETPPT